MRPAHPSRSTAHRPPATLLALLLGSACAVVPDDAKPTVRMGAEIASTYVHRGMPQNTRGVIQGTTDITLPTRNGQSVTLGMFANMDLTSRTGNAWMPNGHGGRVTEVDLTATYAHSFENGIDLAAGLQNYTLPNGESFPNGPREQTNELFVHLQTDFLDARPELQIRHDVDQALGTYIQLGVNEDVELDEHLRLELGSHIAWTSKAQSFWNYGLETSGLADLAGHVSLLYDYDPRTLVGVSLHGSTLLDKSLREWGDLIAIDTDVIWVSAFVSWTF